MKVTFGKSKIFCSCSIATGLMAILMAIPVCSFAEAPIKIGVAAMISPKETFVTYKALLDFIGEKVGRPVELVQKPTYDDMDGALASEEVQVAFICSGPYTKDKKKIGVELLVVPVSYGQPFYNAYIITPKGSPYKSLAELKGKHFTLTDPKSNTGALVPTYMVGTRFNKKMEDFFSVVAYSKSHDKSIEMCAKKLTDGASVDSLIYDYAAATNPQYTKETKIIEKSPAYGIPPIVVTKGMDQGLKKKLRDAFLNVHNDPKGKEIIKKIGVDKFILGEDKNYDSVREMEEWKEKFNAGAK